MNRRIYGRSMIQDKLVGGSVLKVMLRMAGWLVGWLVGHLGGWLVGWLVGWNC